MRIDDKKRYDEAADKCWLADPVEWQDGMIVQMVE